MIVNGGFQTVPTVVFPDGSALTNPSAAQVKERLNELAVELMTGDRSRPQGENPAAGEMLPRRHAGRCRAAPDGRGVERRRRGRA